MNFKNINTHSNTHNNKNDSGTVINSSVHLIHPSANFFGNFASFHSSAFCRFHLKYCFPQILPSYRLFTQWRMLFVKFSDVSMAAIQYLNNYYMVSRQLSREEEFINNCMSHLSEATSDLRSNEESSLQCIQRALLLLMTHLGTFRKRFGHQYIFFFQCTMFWVRLIDNRLWWLFNTLKNNSKVNRSMDNF